VKKDYFTLEKNEKGKNGQAAMRNWTYQHGGEIAF